MPNSSRVYQPQDGTSITEGHKLMPTGTKVVTELS